MTDTADEVPLVPNATGLLAEITNSTDIQTMAGALVPLKDTIATLQNEMAALKTTTQAPLANATTSTSEYASLQASFEAYKRANPSNGGRGGGQGGGPIEVDASLNAEHVTMQADFMAALKTTTDFLKGAGVRGSDMIQIPLIEVQLI